MKVFLTVTKSTFLIFLFNSNLSMIVNIIILLNSYVEIDLWWRCYSREYAESQLLKLGLLIFSIFLFYYNLLYITYITVLLKVVGRFYIPWFWGSENTCFLPIEILHIPFLSISCLVYVNRIIVSQVSPLLRKSWVHSQIPNNQSYRV